jgi:hypothetical protein
VTLGPAIRYPSNPITPHGGYYLLNNRVPQIALRSFDDSIVFNLMGGMAIPDRTTPERVELKDLKGFISNWKTIDQKGASQDGVTFVDALYEPMEPILTLRAVGRDPAHLRQVVSDLIAAVDVKQEAELSCFTHQLGRWWTPVRWFKTPDDALGPINNNAQMVSLRMRADSGFWQSYPHVDQFRFGYAIISDGFDFITAPGDPVTGWTLVYAGGGSGVLYTDGDQAISTFAGDRSVVARRTTFTAISNNTVIDIQLGGNAQPNWPPNTFVDVWARMNNTGTAGADGIRWRMGQSTIKLSSFVAGSETVIREFDYVQGRPTETFRFITGMGGTGTTDSRVYKVLRNNALLQTITEPGTASLADSSHRKVGFGMASTSGIVRPLAIRSWSAGDNSTVQQEGFVQRVNVGDQPMWDRFTCFGPGTFFFANGPDSTEFVKFGPLLTNQIMQVRTDPRKRGVIDMTAIPPTQAEADMFASAKQDFFSFLFSANAVPTSPSATESLFGIVPPQGNPYALLDGRFSTPIPPRSPGNPVTPYHYKVKISGGNADSQIIVAGTPLRRLPY